MKSFNWVWAAWIGVTVALGQEPAPAPTPAPAPAAAETLGIGSPAPKLSVNKWVKGEPVDIETGKGKQVVVVEFWATWCGPCLSSIPHLTAMRHKYADKGVRVVGVTVEDEGNTLEKVEQFVKRFGDKMDYTVGFDKSGDTYKAYMEESEQSGIPTAFLIDRSGVIAWIGHPEGGLEEALSEVVAGTYNLDQAKSLGTLQRRADAASMFRDWDAALKAMDEMLVIKPKSIDRHLNKFFLLAGQMEKHDEAKKCVENIFKLLEADPDKTAEVATMLIAQEDPHGYNAIAAAVLDKAQKAFPNNADVRIAQFQLLVVTGKKDEAAAMAAETIASAKGDATRLSKMAAMCAMPGMADKCADYAVQAIDGAIAAEPQEFQHYATKFFIMHDAKKDHKGAVDVGMALIQKASADADFLNGFAWNLMTDEATAGKYKELALAAAEAMHKAPGGDGWSHLDTLSQAKFENGAVEEAIAIEKQAIEKCDNRGAKAALAENLAKYEKAKGQ